MQVPAAPTSNVNSAGDYDTLYFWQGLQANPGSTFHPPPDAGGLPPLNCGILQPVLQWGNSPAGGGESWGFAAWWWITTYGPPPGGQDGYFTDLVNYGVSTGDSLESYMVLNDTDPVTWTVEMYQNDDNYEILTVPQITDSKGHTCVYQDYYAMAEAVGGGSVGAITSCGQVPPELKLTDIYLDWGYPNQFSYDQSVPTMGFFIQTIPPLPSCSWGVSAGSSGYAGWTTLTMN